MKRYLSSIKRYIWAIPICLLLGALAGFAYGKALPVTFSATSTMMVDVNRPNTYIPGQQQVSSDSLTRATNYAAEIPTRLVMTAIYQANAAISKSGYTVDDLLSDVSATPSLTTATIAITATTSKQNDSVLLANAVAKGFENYVQAGLQQRVNTEIQTLQTQIATYQKQKQADVTQIQQINNSADVRVGLLQSDMADMTRNIETLQGQILQLPTTMQSDVFVVGIATPLGVATSSKTTLLTEAAGVVGLMLGSLLMLILVFLDERLRGADQVKEKLGLAYAGGIFNYRDLKSGSLRPPAEMARQLSDIGINLRLTGILPDRRRSSRGAVLLVTSARAAEGKTTTAVGLAMTIASGGSTVVVVDGNLNRPATHLAFGISSIGPGLHGLLKSTGGETVDSAVVRSNTPGIWLLAGGTPADGSSLLLEQKLPAILDQLSKKTDVVIIDGPPLLSGAGASLMATLVDGIVLVVDARHDKLSVLLRAKDILHSLAHKPAGVILNRLPRQRRDYYFATAYPERKSDVVEESVPVQLSNGNGNGYGKERGLDPIPALPVVTIAPPAFATSGVPLTPGGSYPKESPTHELPQDAAMRQMNLPSPRPMPRRTESSPPPFLPGREK